MHVRGAIKKFSVWPSSLQDKIKTVFASHSSKAQNTTCTIWLLGCKYFVHFSGRQLFAWDMEKTELRSVMKWQFWLIRSFHCMLSCFLRIEVVDPHFILNNKLWTKFWLGYVGNVREVLQKLVHSSGVSILDTIWQTLCSYAEMHKIFIAQKSHCACRVLSLNTLQSKYYFNFILNRTRSSRELFDRNSCNYQFHVKWMMRELKLP